MRVLWILFVEQDRADIVEFIAQDNPLAAIRMDELFSAAVGRLAEHPLMGRPGQIQGTRELIPHESYRLFYEVQPTPSGSWPWCTPCACGRHRDPEPGGSRRRGTRQPTDNSRPGRRPDESVDQRRMRFARGRF